MVGFQFSPPSQGSCEADSLLAGIEVTVATFQPAYPQEGHGE